MGDSGSDENLFRMARGYSGSGSLRRGPGPSGGFPEQIRIVGGPGLDPGLLRASVRSYRNPLSLQEQVFKTGYCLFQTERFR